MVPRRVWIACAFSAIISCMTQTIEIDDDTATALKQRAEERGMSLSELVAELATVETGPAEANHGDIAELDRRWKAFESQGSVTLNEEVVRWLQSWGTPAFRSWPIDENRMVGRSTRRP